MTQLAAQTPTRRAIKFLTLLLCAALLSTLLGVAGRVAIGGSLHEAVDSTGSLHLRLLRVESGSDSWGAMFAAHARLAARAQQPAEASLYAQTLKLDRCKFQYPPSALLLLDLLPAPRIAGYQCEGDDPALLRAIYGEQWAAKRWIDMAARAAVLLTLVVAACVLQALLTATPPARTGAAPASPTARQTTLLWLLTGLTGLLFYPLIQAYHLGQLQVFLNLFVALALLAVLKGLPFVAGALIGLCVLVKPQLVLLLAWAVLRRETALAAGIVIVGGLGHAWALWRYGLALHLDYVRLLATLSQHGEVYWPNQSVNGLLNRWFENGDPWRWSFTQFASYHPVVRWATLASSLAITAAALWFGRRRDGSTGRALDFAAMGAAATLASPIAWEHHYGVFFVFAVLAAGAALTARPAPRHGLLLLVGLSCVLMGQAMLEPEMLLHGRWLGLLASNLWLGAMLLFAVLLLLLQPSKAPAERASILSYARS